MKRLLFILMTSMLCVTTQAAAENNNAKTLCNSAYHLQQQLNLVVNFGDTHNVQNMNVDLDLHVKEINTSQENKKRIHTLRKKEDKIDVRSFIVLVSPNVSKSNDLVIDMSARYKHPFLVLVNSGTGEILDLQSTQTKRDILNEYLSFFDLFQYSEQDGEYRYRNGNGRYNVKMTNDTNKGDPLLKVNQGYLKTMNAGSSKLKILKSKMFITLAKPNSECFYHKAMGIEAFETKLSEKSFVEGHAEVIIESDINRVLDPSHYFFQLTDNLATWPTVEEEVKITKEEAFSKLPFLMTKLSGLIQDSDEFLKTMFDAQTVWPFLSAYILKNGLENKLSLNLFWALNRIDSPESVKALAELSTSEISNRDQFRAILALGNTTEKLDQTSTQLLEDHMTKFSDSNFVTAKKLTYVRMLGAIASSRDANDPIQSAKMKSFLYSQIGRYDTSVNTAVIDAIGNLRSSIDDEGRSILMTGLSAIVPSTRMAASAAFERIPYKREYSNDFIDKISKEKNANIKNKLIEVIGNTTSADFEVKKKLLSLLDSPKFKNTSLNSLKKIDFNYDERDIKALELKLSQEIDSTNQRLLASLILKHRRK